MGKCLRICFKIDKSVGLAVDEMGNRADSYACHTVENVDTYTVGRERYKKLVENSRKLIAESLNCNVEKVIPITLNEYLDNTMKEGLE